MLVYRAIVAIANGEAFKIVVLHFKTENRIEINLLDSVEIDLPQLCRLDGRTRMWRSDKAFQHAVVLAYNELARNTKVARHFRAFREDMVGQVVENLQIGVLALLLIVELRAVVKKTQHLAIKQAQTFQLIAAILDAARAFADEIELHIVTVLGVGWCVCPSQMFPTRPATCAVKHHNFKMGGVCQYHFLQLVSRETFYIVLLFGKTAVPTVRDGNLDLNARLQRNKSHRNHCHPAQ